MARKSRAYTSWDDSYPQGAAAYSRDSYGSGGAAHKRRGGSVAKRVLIAVLAVIVVLVVAVFAYAATFEGKLHGNLSTPEELSKVLTPANADEPYYILLLGSDWRENSGTSDKAEMSGDQQRADVIILARMDPENKQVTLVSVPRDTRWYHDGTVSKINEAYNIGGAALETEAIANLTGVSIAHTVETHFSGLEGLVDALGGVEVDVPTKMSYKDALTGEKVTVQPGRQTINGQEAQIFARVRNAFGGVDSARQGNVRTLVLAIADKFREKPVFEWPGLGLKIADCLGTDMSMGDFIGLVSSFGSGGLTLYSGTGPTAGEIDDNAGGLWLCYENPEGWKAVMDVVNAGGDPSGVDADNISLQAEEEVASGYYDEYGNWIDTSYGGYYDEYGNWIE